MIGTMQFACSLPKAEADALNRESGRIYTDMLVRHYRLYRKQQVWLAPKNGERLEDALGGPTTLHAHSRDAAQQGFYTACKTAQRRRGRDMEHKVSHAVVMWAKERQIGMLVIGDVRDVADGKRLNTKTQHKLGLWSHGRQRCYITYKAEASGITITEVEEAYTSQTCPRCLDCHEPKGRVYCCPVCGFTGHRDGLGAANLLSQHYTGEPGHVWPPKETYRYPVWGKRSRLDTHTAEMAWGQRSGKGHPKKLPGFNPGTVSHLALAGAIMRAISTREKIIAWA